MKHNVICGPTIATELNIYLVILQYILLIAQGCMIANSLTLLYTMLTPSLTDRLEPRASVLNDDRRDSK